VTQLNEKILSVVGYFCVLLIFVSCALFSLDKTICGYGTLGIALFGVIYIATKLENIRMKKFLENKHD